MQGLNALAQGSGDAYSTAYRDAAYVDIAAANARNADSDSALNQQKYATRQSIPELLANVPGPPGAAPGSMAALFNASEKPDIAHFTEATGRVADQARQQQAEAAALGGNSTLMNQLTSITAQKPYTPYALNETGRIDAGTGEYQLTPGHQALVGQRDAAAAQSLAGARENNAQAQAAGMLEVSPGASVYSVPQGGRQGGVMGAMAPLMTAPPNPSTGANQPSNASKVMQELMAIGVPEDAARANAYKSLRQVQDARGNTAVLDGLSSQVTGSLVNDPRTGTVSWQPAAPVPPAASPAAPPAPGARLAPDGNWYVQQDGQWFKVEP